MAAKVTVPADLAEALRCARSVMVLTGAGVSAESGLATFRDPETGLWSNVDLEAVASPAGFRRDPVRAWTWYVDRRRAMDAARPNAGHLALAEIERRVPACALVTQNIDGLHQRAGNRAVLELHGSIHRARCTAEGTVLGDWPVDGPMPPTCASCGALLRPDVVWFGESLPMAVLMAAEQAALTADVCLSVGTSGMVEPAASLPFLARRAGAVVVEVNPEPTPLTASADHVLAAGAASALPALVAAAWPEASRARGAAA
jgi:NAD-dependent deacetylase